MADRTETAGGPRLAGWMIIGACLIGGLVATPALAEQNTGYHHPAPRRHHDYRRAPPRHYDHHRDWGRPSYYGGRSAVIGAAPIYVPPPVVYAPAPPPFGLNLMFNIR